MIQATALTKRYGTRLAVDHADFTVAPGAVHTRRQARVSLQNGCLRHGVTTRSWQ